MIKFINFDYFTVILNTVNGKNFIYDGIITEINSSLNEYLEKMVFI